MPGYIDETLLFLTSFETNAGLHLSQYRCLLLELTFRTHPFQPTSLSHCFFLNKTRFEANCAETASTILARLNMEIHHLWKQKINNNIKIKSNYAVDWTNVQLSLIHTYNGYRISTSNLGTTWKHTFTIRMDHSFLSPFGEGGRPQGLPNRVRLAWPFQ